MALEWFKPDLLLFESSKFILELQMNFSSYDPIDNAEHQLHHLLQPVHEQVCSGI